MLSPPPADSPARLRIRTTHDTFAPASARSRISSFVRLEWTCQCVTLRLGGFLATVSTAAAAALSSTSAALYAAYSFASANRHAGRTFADDASLGRESFPLARRRVFSPYASRARLSTRSVNVSRCDASVAETSAEYRAAKKWRLVGGSRGDGSGGGAGGGGRRGRPYFLDVRGLDRTCRHRRWRRGSGRGRVRLPLHFDSGLDRLRFRRLHRFRLLFRATGKVGGGSRFRSSRVGRFLCRFCRRNRLDLDLGLDAFVLTHNLPRILRLRIVRVEIQGFFVRLDDILDVVILARVAVVLASAYLVFPSQKSLRPRRSTSRRRCWAGTAAAAVSVPGSSQTNARGSWVVARPRLRQRASLSARPPFWFSSPFSSRDRAIPRAASLRDPETVAVTTGDGLAVGVRSRGSPPLALMTLFWWRTFLYPFCRNRFAASESLW